MRRLLSRPYPLEPSAARHTIKAVLFGAFVAVFLLLFRPFGLYAAPHLSLLAAGYGATCTATMLLLNVLLPRLLVRWFDEARWTLGRELAWTALNVAAIGLANALLSAALGLVPLNAITLVRFTIFTVSIGLFPVALAVLIAEARRARHFRTDSAAINAQLRSPTLPSLPDTPPTGVLTLPTEGGAAPLVLGMDELLYLRAADNYVEVFHRNGSQHKRTVLRGSLKAMAGALQGHGDRYLRCHKSHLVDLQKVQRVSGNAQGLRLHLVGVDEPIPVSRQLTAMVRAQLADRP